MIKVALVGCGRISSKHIEAIKNTDGLSLVACCDTVEEKAAKVAAENNCIAYTDLDTMLDETNAELVSICTPSGLHPQHVVKVASHRKHALSEKPFGCSIKACEEAIKACDDNEVHLFVVKQNRLNPSIQLLRKAFEERRFGKLYMILANVLWTRPQSYYDEASWRGTWELDGGCLSNQASHYVDLVQWFGGSIEDVRSVASTQARNIQAEDTISVSIRFTGGTIGNINATTLVYPRNLEGSLTLIGERGTARVGGFALNKIEHWEFDAYHEMDKLVANTSTNPSNVYGHGHTPFYEHVFRTLNGLEKPFTDGVEAIKTVEIIEAAYASSQKKGKG